MASDPGSQSNSVVAWIYIDGNIRKTQLDGFIYDKPIDRSRYGLKLFYRCKNPDDMKYGIVPIEDDDDVELMFGVVVSKGTLFFTEIYLEKISNGELIESSSRVAEMSCSRYLEGQTSSSRCFGGETSSSRFMEVSEGAESGMRTEKSAAEYVDNSRNFASFDSILRTRDDVLSPIELREGVVFASKDELAHTVNQVHIRSHQEIVVTRSNQLNWHVACKWKDDGCEWKLKARKRSAHGYLEEVTFKRVFWDFKPCIDGFEHCIPVIQIDNTHLYKPYPGVLLCATTVDGFNHIRPLAFVIVEAENLSSWD
ncbi:hypothetical protein POM88_036114 [Heracleum sosnowskyi]|uniref:Transposase MuDR plant domain-containing protein n=1 Tax=Heracleum sosnowskyi TaxID=360622 RepID=A0AAD8MEL2_9APIA|nr:hypothetical protein POM88_036114 [Heracleum sosnowskyi]